MGRLCTREDGLSLRYPHKIRPLWFPRWSVGTSQTIVLDRNNMGIPQGLSVVPYFTLFCILRALPNVPRLVVIKLTIDVYSRLILIQKSWSYR